MFRFNLNKRNSKKPTAVARKVLEVPAGPDAPVVVCFHGYYSNAYRLRFLAQDKGIKKPVRWLFPNSSTRMGLLSLRRKWFPIDHKFAKRIIKSGDRFDGSGMRPDGLDEAHDAARKFIDALAIPWDRLIIGGHSQGAILALELALQAPENPLGLFLLSGHPVDAAGIRRRAPNRTGTPFFQSHGLEDPVLPVEKAQDLERMLSEAGLKGELLRYMGGHRIPNEVRAELAKFIDSLA